MKKMILLVAIMLLTCETYALKKEKKVEIGSYYAEVLNGISYIIDNNAAFLFRIGWIDSNGAYGDKNIFTRPMRYGEASPNGSISRISWQVADGTWITFTWSRDQFRVVGNVTSSAPIKIITAFTPSWDKFYSFYRMEDNRIVGEGYTSGELKDRKATIVYTPSRAAIDSVCFSFGEDLSKYMLAGKSANSGRSTYAAKSYMVDKDKPVSFIADIFTDEVTSMPSENNIEAYVVSKIEDALAEYNTNRVRSEGDWGDFLGTMTRVMNHFKVYNFQTGRVAHTITRDWCRKDGTIIFEWDTYFNALLAAFEDPEGAKETVRSVLDMQQDNGLIPSYYGTRWEISWDRSQPPVGAMCVWKINEMWPDKEFLAEVYDRMKRHHDWWFAYNEVKGSPNRDCNNDGLLEWGTDNFPELYYGGYESGLDDSPMWDNVRVNQKSGAMELNDVGLNSLWAMDAYYLSLIAKELGFTDDSKRFLSEYESMRNLISKELWNDKTGTFQNRYWSKESLRGILLGAPLNDMDIYQSSNGDERGFKITYYKDRDMTNVSRELIVNNLSELNYHKDELSSKISAWYDPQDSGEFKFTVSAIGTIKFICKGKTLLDNQIATWRSEYETEPLYLEKGDRCELIIENRPNEGYKGVTIGIKGNMAEQLSDDLFSSRQGVTTFYPMILNNLSKKQSKGVVTDLTNEKRFWGEYVVPTISMDDPAFPQQDYWRGNIWAPTNYLVYLGAKNYLNREDSYTYAERAVKLFMENWHRAGGVHENYYSNGIGGARNNYSWGALMLLTGYEYIMSESEKSNGKHKFILHNIPINGEKKIVKKTL